MIQLILHLLGDYVTQSDWMAQNKTKSSWAALCHATVYSLPFLLIGSVEAVIVIWSTHFVIDRFRLARYVCWLKNVLLSPRPQAPCVAVYRAARDLHEEAMQDVEAYEATRRRYRWTNCSATGYPSETPPWMAVWLLIAADNTLHLVINHLALLWL